MSSRNKKSDKTSDWKWRAVQFVAMCLGAFLGVAVLGCFFFMQSTLISARGILLGLQPSTALTDKEEDFLEGLIYSGEIMTSEVFLGAVNTLYGNVIQLLLVIIGLVSALGFIYIRFTTKSEALEIVEDAVTSDSGTAIIRQTIFDSDEYSGIQDLLEDQEALERRLEDIESQLTAISEKLSEKDDPDDDEKDDSTLEITK